MAIVNSAMGAATRTGYDVMRLYVAQWEEDLIEYRCSLSRSTVRRVLGSTKGWDCRDIKFFVGKISFEEFDRERREKLNEIPTRLRLKTEQVDLAIEAGREATLTNPEVRGFMLSTKADGVSPLVALRKQGAAPRRISPIKN